MTKVDFQDLMKEFQVIYMFVGVKTLNSLVGMGGLVFYY